MGILRATRCIAGLACRNASDFAAYERSHTPRLPLRMDARRLRYAWCTYRRQRRIINGGH